MVQTDEEHNVTTVKVPNFLDVTIRVNIGIHTIGKDKGRPVTATKEIISKEPFPKEWDIVETRPVTLMLTNKCPKCDQQGIPRINKKNNKDYSQNRGSYNKEEPRLSYWHKVVGGKAKACYISDFNMSAIIDTRKVRKGFTNTNKISDSIEAVDYIFPNYVIKNI